MEPQIHGPEKVEFSRNWNITKLVLSTASLVCCVVVVGLGIVIASWGGVFSTQEALFGITTATVCFSSLTLNSLPSHTCIY